MKAMVIYGRDQLHFMFVPLTITNLLDRAHPL